MPERNDRLRDARLRRPSSRAPGDHASRAEIAEAASAWLWRVTGARSALDAHYLAKMERGVVRWPNAAYRSALRQVLGAGSDDELGFHPPRRCTDDDRERVRPDPPPIPGSDADEVAETAGAMTRDDLAPTGRRAVLAGAGVLVGSALVGELTPLLGQVRYGSRQGCTAFSADELDAAGRLVALLRSWHSRPGTLALGAVIAQLNAHAKRLRRAPQGTPETLRAFRIGAELAEVAASMNWDAGQQRAAQRYFVLSAQLAHAGGDDTLAGVALAALARQCFDLGRSADGLEVVQLAQYGTRRVADPGLRALLATREAWAHAQLGDLHAFRRAVDLAESHHSEAAPAVRPDSPWRLDDAELAGVVGGRYRDLARRHPGCARAAQEHTERALRLRPRAHLRNRTFDLVGLARTHLVTREPERAGELVIQAIALAGPWVKGRVGAKLLDFHRESAGFTSVPIMRDARAAITDLTAVR